MSRGESSSQRPTRSAAASPTRSTAKLALYQLVKPLHPNRTGTTRRPVDGHLLARLPMHLGHGVQRRHAWAAGSASCSSPSLGTWAVEQAKTNDRVLSPTRPGQRPWTPTPPGAHHRHDDEEATPCSRPGTGRGVPHARRVPASRTPPHLG